MKFVKADMGWRYLKVSKYGAELTVSIPDRKVKCTPTTTPFISCANNYNYADVNFTRAQLRKLANKILKELDHK